MTSSEETTSEVTIITEAPTGVTSEGTTAAIIKTTEETTTPNIVNPELEVTSEISSQETSQGITEEMVKVTSSATTGSPAEATTEATTIEKATPARPELQTTSEASSAITTSSLEPKTSESTTRKIERPEGRYFCTEHRLE